MSYVKVENLCKGTTLVVLGEKTFTKKKNTEKQEHHYRLSLVGCELKTHQY